MFYEVIVRYLCVKTAYTKIYEHLTHERDILGNVPLFCKGYSMWHQCASYIRLSM